MKIDICGLPVDVISTEEVVSRVVAHGESALGRPLIVSSCNVDMVVKSHRDPGFGGTLGRADILTADGMPIVWLGRRLGGAFPERVAGSELVPRVSARCAEKGLSIFLFGARPGVAQRAAEALLKSCPGLRVAGTLSPPMGFDADPDALAAAVATVREARPDVLFVAMGAPRQERFMEAHSRALGAKVILGVGGSLDMLAGEVRRAPPFVQRMGAEWLYRLLQEPRRLSRRYLVDDVAFLPLALRALRARRAAARSLE